jgi:hypothetical protein
MDVESSCKKKKRGHTAPPGTTPHSFNCLNYFFFDFALLVDFAFDFAAGFFAVAIVLTTFHAVRDLTVAPIWQMTPE